MSDCEEVNGALDEVKRPISEIEENMNLSDFEPQEESEQQDDGEQRGGKQEDYAVPAAEEVKEEEAPAVEEEEALDNSEVLQESDVDHFSTEPVVEEPADEVLSYHSEEPVEMYEPEPEPQPEPVYVTETTVRRLSLNSPNENIKPEGAGSPKKLGGGVWPPREEMNFSKGGTLEEGAAPGKKRISDLIARFNSGTVENEGAAKNDHRYKSEYGAGGQRGGKVQQSVFQ